MRTVNDTVRANVKRLREEWHWSLRALAKELEKHGHRLLPSTLSDVENGKRRVDVDDLVAFARAFRVEVEALLGPRTWRVDHRATAETAVAHGAALPAEATLTVAGVPYTVELRPAAPPTEQDDDSELGGES